MLRALAVVLIIGMGTFFGGVEIHAHSATTEVLKPRAKLDCPAHLRQVASASILTEAEVQEDGFKSYIMQVIKRGQRFRDSLPSTPNQKLEVPVMEFSDYLLFSFIEQDLKTRFSKELPQYEGQQAPEWWLKQNSYEVRFLVVVGPHIDSLDLDHFILRSIPGFLELEWEAWLLGTMNQRSRIERLGNRIRLNAEETELLASAHRTLFKHLRSEFFPGLAETQDSWADEILRRKVRDFVAIRLGLNRLNSLRWKTPWRTPSQIKKELQDQKLN